MVSLYFNNWGFSCIKFLYFLYCTVLLWGILKQQAGNASLFSSTKYPLYLIGEYNKGHFNPVTSQRDAQYLLWFFPPWCSYTLWLRLLGAGDKVVPTHQCQWVPVFLATSYYNVNGCWVQRIHGEM